MANVQTPAPTGALSQLLARRPVILQFLKFGTIGAINTSLDFLILNFLSKSLGINVGLDLGLINIIGVAAATIQSYFWNRGWTFSLAIVSPLKNFIRLFLVGGLGAGTFLLVLIGAGYEQSANFYLIILVLFLLMEIILWKAFGLTFHVSNDTKNVGQQFIEFIIVSVIGVVINSFVVVIVSSWLAEPLSNIFNDDLIKNLAKFAAICVAMVWNFIGYKLFVFKK